jgi:signal transduction histidine kinase
MSVQGELQREISVTFCRSVLDALDGGLMVVDLSGRITYVNESARRILAHLSIGASDLLGEILGPEAAAAILDSRPGPLKPGGEFTLQGPDGEVKVIGFTTAPRRDPQGEVNDLVVSFREITGLRLLRGGGEAMDRFGTVAEIASAVAHEIRNPLAGIRTMAQSVHENMLAGDGNREYLVRIIRQVDRLNDILKEFFAYARLPKPKRSSCSLFGIIQEVKALVEKSLQDRRVALFEDYQPGMADLYVDPDQIQQVILNLLLNAAEAIGQGGEISLAARLARNHDLVIFGHQNPRLIGRTDLAMMTFRDNGPGMRQDVVERIFEPFFTTKTGGTGLGLSIVHRIVEANDGAIFVNSGEGVGTVFTLFLPVGLCALPG